MIDAQRLQLDILARAVEAAPGLTCVAEILAGAVPDPRAGDAIDAFLVSVHHPGIDLVAHVAAVRAAHPTSTVIALAGYVDLALAEAAHAAGADATLPTSTPLEPLLEALAGRPLESAHSIDRDEIALDQARSLGLTRRQHEVLRQLAEGRSPSQVAELLAITLDTCRDHIRALHRVLGCTSTTEVVIVGARTGLLPELSRPLR